METDNQPKKQYDWLREYQWQKGQSGNPAGRPKGKSLKTWVKEFLENLSEEGRLEFIKMVDADMVWRMAEGNPKEAVEVSGELNNPFINLTDEQKFERIRLFVEGIRKDKSEGRPDIPAGGDIGIPKVQPDTLGSGEVPEEGESTIKKGDTVVAEKPSQDDRGNDRVDNPATDK